MKSKNFRLSTPAIALVALLLIVSGCGSSSGSSSTGSSSEANSQFKTNATNKKIVDFGEEASAEEREAAGSVLAENLKAREAGDFSSQCSSLNLKAVEKLVGPGKKNPRGTCPTALQKVAEPLSQSKNVRKDTLGGPIAALRVEGNRGYALYHGTDGKNYAMPMEEEGGTWKVGALLTTGI